MKTLQDELVDALWKCVNALDTTLGDTDSIDDYDDGSAEFEAFRNGLTVLEKVEKARENGDNK